MIEDRDAEKIAEELVHHVDMVNELRGKLLRYIRKNKDFLDEMCSDYTIRRAWDKARRGYLKDLSNYEIQQTVGFISNRKKRLIGEQKGLFGEEPMDPEIFARHKEAKNKSLFDEI